MALIQLDDGYPEHPKVVGLSDAALAMEIRAMCYATRRSTDGFLPDGCLRLLTGAAPAQKVAAELVESGRWERDDERGGYWIHDFLEHNPSIAQQRARRAAAAARMRRSRARSRSGTGSAPTATQPPLPGAMGSAPAAPGVEPVTLGAAGNGNGRPFDVDGQPAGTAGPVTANSHRTQGEPGAAPGRQARPAPAASSPEGAVTP